VIFIANFAVTGTYDGSAIERGLQQLDQSIQKISSSMENIKAPRIDTSAAQNDISKLAASMKDIQGGVMSQKEIGDIFGKGAMDKVATDWTQLLKQGIQDPMGAAKSAASDMVDRLGAVGIAGMAVAGGLAAIGAASVQVASQFETSMSRIQALTGQSTKGLYDLAKVADDTATIGEAGTAMEQLAQQGMHVQDMAKALPAALALSDATGQSTATTTDELTNALKRFQLGSDQSTHVINTMVAAAQKGRTSVSELDGAMRLAGPVAAQAGLSYDQTAAAISRMTGAGLSTRAAGSQLSTFLGNLTSPNKEFTDSMASLGISMDQVDPKLHSFDQIITTLESHGTAAGKALGPGMAAVLGDGIGSYTAYTSSISNTNAALDAGAAATANYEGNMKRLSANISRAEGDLGNLLMPTLGKVSGFFAELSLEADLFGERLSILVPKMLAVSDAWILKQYGLTPKDPVKEQVANQMAAANDYMASYSGEVVNLTGSSISTLNTAGNLAGTTFGDAMGNVLKTKIPKSVSDGYLAAGGLSTKAGETAGESFAAAQDAYIKSHSSGAYSDSLMGMMAGQTSDSMSGGGAQNTTMFNDLGMKTIMSRVAATNDKSAYVQMFDGAGKALSDQIKYINWDDAVGKNLSDSVKPIILSIPKYMETKKDDISKVFKDAISDGIVDLDETKTFKDLSSELEAMGKGHPIEFQAAGLPKMQSDINAALAGTYKINIDPVTTEADFEVWLQDNAKRFEAQYTKTGVMPTRESQRERFNFEQTATDEQKKYLKGMDTATTGGASEASGGLVYAQALLNTDPGLKKAAWFNQETGTEAKNLTDHVKKVDGTFIAIGDDGKALGPTFVDIDTAGKAMNGGFANLAVTVPAANSSLAQFPAAMNAATQAANRFAAIGIPTTQMKFNTNTPTFQNNQRDMNQMGSFFSGAGVASQYTNLMTSTLFDSLKIPHLGTGGITTGKGGIAVIGESGQEAVIPLAAIKNLLPQTAEVDKTSFQYQTNDQFFDDYGRTIRGSGGQRWGGAGFGGHLPEAAPIAMTGTNPMAWLKDTQTSGMDSLNNQLREMQISSYGIGNVIPWFARPPTSQTAWWLDTVKKLAPDVAWSTSKGDKTYYDQLTAAQTAMKAPDASLKGSPVLTNRDIWNLIYRQDGACIGFAEPDPSLNFTPGKAYLPGGSGLGNMNQSVAGISSSDKLAVNLVGKSDTTLSAIEKNTQKSAVYLQEQTKYFTSGPGGQSTGFFGNGGNDTPLVTSGMAPVDNYSAWNAIYDNKGTCVAFVEPDPSLNFTPNKDYQKGGYRLGNMGGGQTSLGDQEIQTMDPVVVDAMARQNALSDQANKEASKTAKNTDKIARDIGATVNGGTTSGGLVINGGAGGAGWGGRSFNGGGGWIGTSGVMGGMNGGTYYGSTAGSGNVSWGGAAAVSGGGGSPAMGNPGGGWSSFFAEGGISYGQTSMSPGGNIFAEKPGLVEAFVPISDRAAGLRILPQVMAELGVRRFASGGFSGNASNISAAIGGINLGGITVINQANQRVDEKKLAAEIIKKVEQKQYNAWKGR
jgi:TP901 family phage tail tape measure protein